jgi:hypothetical protein
MTSRHTRHAKHAASPLARLIANPGTPLKALTHHMHQLIVTVEGLLPWVASAIAVILVFATVAGRLRDRRVGRDARVIRVGVPPEVESGGAELLWSVLHDILRPPFKRLLEGQPHLSWEITADEFGTAFQLWVPRQVPPGLIERAISAAWPGATISELEDDPAQRFMNPATVELTLSGPDWFPLGGRDGTDPLVLVLGQLAGLEDGERALVQILAQPLTVRAQQRLLTVARRLRAGVPTSRLGRALEFFSPGPAPVRATMDPALNPDVRAVMDKASSPLYRCQVRIAVETPRRAVTRGRIHAIAGAFAGYEGRVGLRRRRSSHGRAQTASRSLRRRSFLLSVPELAALAHLPEQASLPGLVRAGARSVAPPPGLAASGKQLGVSTATGRPVSLGVEDARFHMHVLGPTGVGKSTFIAQLALSDFNAGRGAVVIDPKGDLVEDILNRIPSGREQDVDLLDPHDSTPPGLNVLEGPDKELVVDQTVGIFHRVFERFWGPRTDDILRAALLTLTATPGTTLVDVPRLLTDKSWRRQLVSKIDDPVGVGSFWDWYEGLSEATQAQATGPVLNKLRAFLLRKSVRAIIGQPVSSIDIGRCLDQGRLLLVRLPKGTLGEDTSSLLGSFVVARTWQAALARAGRPEDQRPDSALYIDEVHNYLNLPTALEDILAEARGYHLSICLAHQHLAQLRREMREGIAANARTKIYFQLSTPDAAALGKDFEPELAAHDLANLAAHQVAARICQNGRTTPAFTLATTPLPAGDADRGTVVRESARARYGSSSDEIDDALRRRSELATTINRHERVK